MGYVIKVFKRGMIDEEIEIKNSMWAWDCYQFYRMSFPTARVTMTDIRTNEVIATGKG